jgi:hypothetical protein
MGEVIEDFADNFAIIYTRQPRKPELRERLVKINDYMRSVK